ncbi:ribonuclease H-like protein [Trametopsis cervina]|nr:ribonuclease H-like protein [Trametopsis cervina]
MENGMMDGASADTDVILADAVVDGVIQSQSMIDGGTTQSTLVEGVTQATEDEGTTQSTMVEGETQPMVVEETAKPAAETETPEVQLYSYKDYKPEPIVRYARTETQADWHAAKLSGPIGFDMEWRVSRYRGGPQYLTAVVQLADMNTILIVHVSAMKKIPQKVKAIIEDPSIPKIGANIRNDGIRLWKDYGVVAANLVELGALARQADPDFEPRRNIVALATMIETYCDGKTLDKGPVRCSNWECPYLAQAQITYAANDAHSALMAYKRIMRIAVINERTLDPNEFASDISPEQLQLEETAKKAAAEAKKAAAEAKKAEAQAKKAEAEAKKAAAELAAFKAQNTADPASAGPPSSSEHPLQQDAPAAAVPTTSVAVTFVEPVIAIPIASITSGSSSTVAPRPRHLQAYRMWNQQNMTLDEICASMRSKEHPLAKSTVITYVMGVLQHDPTLPFSIDRLKMFVQADWRSWNRHKRWILHQEGKAKLEAARQMPVPVPA